MPGRFERAVDVVAQRTPRSAVLGLGVSYGVVLGRMETRVRAAQRGRGNLSAGELAELLAEAFAIGAEHERLRVEAGLALSLPDVERVLEWRRGWDPEGFEFESPEAEELAARLEAWVAERKVG